MEFELNRIQRIHYKMRHNNKNVLILSLSLAVIKSRSLWVWFFWKYSKLTATRTRMTSITNELLLRPIHWLSIFKMHRRIQCVRKQQQSRRDELRCKGFFGFEKGRRICLTNIKYRIINSRELWRVGGTHWNRDTFVLHITNTSFELIYFTWTL